MPGVLLWAVAVGSMDHWLLRHTACLAGVAHVGGLWQTLKLLLHRGVVLGLHVGLPAGMKTWHKRSKAYGEFARGYGSAIAVSCGRVDDQMRSQLAGSEVIKINTVNCLSI